ncbi:ABC transporter permease [Solicola gregarius]|uniref:ABC transporter permease n=1 Tax=Solicola gregarius TaxID=2908642 RepID=A0AA46TJ40_9ACTN|nr:ABC transporter permease [Solicola gregarius]UYM06063.1 ABC transporter permease [Solicola gregarius]
MTDPPVTAASDASSNPGSAGRLRGLRYLARRLTHFVISLVVLVTGAFLMVELVPGDAAQTSAGANASGELVEQRRVELGLDRPLPERYVRLWTGMATGDLGESTTLRVPVSEVLKVRLPATLELALLAVFLILLLAVPIGLAAGALTRGGRRPMLEAGYTSTATVLSVIPEFLLGVGLVYVFAVQTDLLPVAGRSGPASYVLPVAALVGGSTAALSRIVRAETLNVLDQDYVRTARAKRMSWIRLYLRHVLPNILTTTLTLSGLLLGGMMAGTVLVENIFAWPGLGATIVQAIISKDYPLVQAIVITYGILILLINLVIDLLLMVVDPRTTLRES